MQDYPEDCDGGMSQVFNGEKMLFDSPSEIATPTVRVNGCIYYVDELLQQSSGAYFIPERFFYAKDTEGGSDTGVYTGRQLFSLGYVISESIVSHLLVISHT